jgi:hypothetical protein
MAKTGNTMIIPTDLANVAGFIKTAVSVVKDLPTGGVPSAVPPQSHKIG